MFYTLAMYKHRRNHIYSYDGYSHMITDKMILLVNVGNLIKHMV